MADSAVLYLLGTVLIFAGVFIIALATILMSVLRSKKGKTEAAGVIVVGPIPIIFGKDRKSVKTILLLSVTLTVFLIAAMLVYYFFLR